MSRRYFVLIILVSLFFILFLNSLSLATETATNEVSKPKSNKGLFLGIGYSGSEGGLGVSAASSLKFGIGYKYGLTEGMDLSFTVDTSNYNSDGVAWNVTPILINLIIGWARLNPDLKEYIEIGFGYYLTDLKEDNKNLSTFGFRIGAGLERSFGKHGGLYIETGGSPLKVGKYDTHLEGNYLMVGYRF